MNGIKLNDYKKMSINDVKKMLKPQYIYISLPDDSKCLVKKKDYVYKGMVIGLNSDNFPIHSSVSGTVLGKSKYLDTSNNMSKCVVIENDFKELYETRLTNKRNISLYTKDEFIKIIKEAGIVGLGGGAYPTYKKYMTDKINTLVVNAVECEPYITSDYMLMNTKTEEILEAIDAILEINKINEAYFVIKGKHEKLIALLNQYKGSYPNIKIITVDDKYPYGWEKNTVKLACNVTYKRYPSEKGIVVNNVSTIYAIYEALKYHKPLIERIITVSGDNILYPTNCLVKTGTSIDELITELGGYKDNEQKSHLVAGGPMMGVALTSDEAMISSATNSLLCLTKKEQQENKCFRCGKCSLICPVKLEPVLVSEYLDDEEVLRKSRVLNCIECGLCSYICPAKIEIREKVRLAKKKVK